MESKEAACLSKGLHSRLETLRKAICSTIASKAQQGHKDYCRDRITPGHVKSMIALYKDYCCPEVRFKLGTGYFPQANV